MDLGLAARYHCAISRLQ